MALPTLKLKPREDKRLRAGHTWIFSNEVDVARTPLTRFAPGELARVESDRGRALGIAYVNSGALICARLLTRFTAETIDEAWFRKRLRRALALRERLFDAPFYRAVFGESDGLPGLVVDRFGDVLAAQFNTVGMEAQREVVLAALRAELTPATIVLRNDSPMRALEGLASAVETLGEPCATVEVPEGAARFAVPPGEGQKTGWYFDQRDNRLRVASYVRGGRVLDVFSYVGAWGIQAALAGASSVTCVDSSGDALALAADNARRNGVSVDTRQGQALDVLRALDEARERFDVVIIDPPALIKRRRDVAKGAEHYARLYRTGMRLLGDDGILVAASCSHHLSRDQLQRILAREAQHEGRHLQLLERRGASVDHPVHPAIPETDYLKAFFCRVCRF